MLRHTAVIVALLPWPGWTAPARAESYYWNPPGGGAFTSPSNWQPFDPDPPGIALGPGGPGDGVHFDLGVLPGDLYTVTQVSGVNHELLIHADSLRLEFSDDYSLANMTAGVPNFVIGVDPGDAAHVVLTGSGGAVFQPLRTFIAASPGSSGTAIATGSDWLWDVGHQLMVGWYGTGILTIEEGADVISAAPLIGAFEGSTGAVSVRGAGSSWIASGQLSVAVGGSAAMAIEDGAGVSSGSGSIGNSSGSLGEVSVRGERSRWDLGLGLFVGYGGTGALAIEDGGRVTGGDAWLGGWEDEGFGTAQVSVRGQGSRWTLEQDCGACEGGLTVGVSHSATLTIEDGGSIANGNGWIGLNPGSTGTAVVRGTLASWDNAGQLFVGDAGTGTLVIEAGGNVASMDGWLGVDPDSAGTVSVRDPGSSWAACSSSAPRARERSSSRVAAASRTPASGWGSCPARRARSPCATPARRGTSQAPCASATPATARSGSKRAAPSRARRPTSPRRSARPAPPPSPAPARPGRPASFTSGAPGRERSRSRTEAPSPVRTPSSATGERCTSAGPARSGRSAGPWRWRRRAGPGRSASGSRGRPNTDW